MYVCTHMHIQVETLLPDVMHDLLEGTLQFEAKLILRHVITERYISYPKFARLLAGLELGYMEADNRPLEIASSTISSSEKTLRQKGILVGRVAYRGGVHWDDVGSPPPPLPPSLSSPPLNSIIISMHVIYTAQII